MANADRELEQSLVAAITGAYGSPDWLTSDMVELLLGGHDGVRIEEVKERSDQDETRRN